MFNLYMQTPTPRAPANFDLSFVWYTIRGLWYELLARLPYIMVALVALLLFVLAGRLVKIALTTAGRRTRFDLTLSDLLGRLASAFGTVLGLFVAAVIIFPTFRPVDLIAGLGITSIVIGFAFRDVLQNFFAGLLILWRRPFVVGDEIKAGEYEGTVEEITARSTRLRTYDGERAVLPNAQIYTNALLVRSAYSARRIRLGVGIGYPDSIESGRSIIHQVLKKTEGVLEQPGPWVYVTELAPSSVNFNVYFWTESHQFNVLEISDRVITGIKLALDKAGIDIPYPHRVVLLHNVTRTRREGDNSASERE